MNNRLFRILITGFLVIMFSYTHAQYFPNYWAARKLDSLGNTYDQAAALAQAKKNDSAYLLMNKLSDSLKNAENWEYYLMAQNELGTMYFQHENYKKTQDVMNDLVKTSKAFVDTLSTEFMYTYKALWFSYYYANEIEKLKEVQDYRYLLAENRTDQHIISKAHYALDIDAYDELSISYLITGNYQKHYECIEKAFEITEKINWTYKLNMLYGQFGINLYRSGYLDYATQCLEKKYNANTLSGYYDSVNAVYNCQTLNSVYFDNEDYDKSLSFIKQSINIMDNIEHPFSLIYPGVYYQAANTYYAIKENDSAQYYYDKSLKSALENDIFHTQIAIYQNNADDFFNHGQKDSAIFYNNLALEILASESINQTMRAPSYLFSTELYSKLGNLNKALQIAQEGLQSYSDLTAQTIFVAPILNDEQINEKVLFLYKEKILSLILYMNENPVENDMEIIKEHFTEYDRLFVMHLKENTNKTVINNLLLSYRGLIDSIVNYCGDHSSGNSELLYSFVNRGKGISLFIEKQQLEFNKLSQQNDVATIEFNKNKTLIFKLENQLALLDPNKYADSINMINDKLLTLRRKVLLKEFQMRFEVINNLEQEAFSAIKLNEYEHIPENTALLEYHLSDKYLNVFCLSRDGLVHKTLPNEGIDKIIMNYYRHIKTSNNNTSASNQLYDFLIASVEKSIQNKTHLVIIPDKKLNKIPFEALSKNNEYLINNYTISYSYSYQLWKSEQKKLNNTEYETDFLAIAPGFLNSNEEYSIDRSIVATIENDSLIYRDNYIMKALPHTSEEISEINKIFANNELTGVLLKNEEANKEGVMQNISNAKIIHLATHGILNKKNPYLSGLALSPEFDTITNSDILYHFELYDTRMNADLVVLSACKSGTGKMITGEGVMALPRGFIYAGVPNVVASLWKVHDEKTKDLMIYFYKHLLEDQVSYAEALRLAKLDCIKNGFPPVDWASFVIIGD